jgi:SAM-dependent methyltransferase
MKRMEMPHAPRAAAYYRILSMRTKQHLGLALVVLLGIFRLEAAAGQSSTNRSDALRLLCQRLEIGPGAVVADVGCGEGLDSMVFAEVVGAHGTVLAQEIDTAKLKKVVEIAGRRDLHQVVPVLGQSEDPHLPDGFANLIYMNRVFHHFARPQAMLEHLASDLKPGGWLVIVDQQKGPLTDWAPMESREAQHHWTGETTVVRLAREAGFLFHGVLDELWYEKQPFVLAFRKPMEPIKTPGDPDLPQPLDVKDLVRNLPPRPAGDSAVVFFGLDRGRAVVPTLQEMLPSSSRFYDVVINEWALLREELPPEAQRPGIQILRTEKNNLALPADVPLGLVLFVDAYHRLWEPLPLLRCLRERLPNSGWVAVIDRKGPEAEPRRLAGHQRRISPALVVEEMRQAGFHLRQTLPPPAKDRFFLLFGLDGSSSP